MCQGTLEFFIRAIEEDPKAVLGVVDVEDEVDFNASSLVFHAGPIAIENCGRSGLGDFTCQVVRLKLSGCETSCFQTPAISEPDALTVAS